MSELRQDMVTKEWVIIATDRAKRPENFFKEFASKQEQVDTAEKLRHCPFCYGNEGKTPPEVLAFRENGKPNSPDWLVRVVPNKFPAVEYVHDFRVMEEHGYRYMNGYGIHEVIIETPDHYRGLGMLRPSEMHDVIRAFVGRYRDLSQDKRLRYIQIFRNHGPDAGASLEHPHSQLVAIPFIPPAIQIEMDGSRDYYLEHGRCAYCSMIEMERNLGSRIIMENKSFIVFAPYAARFPFETWILPLRHQSSFAELNEKEEEDLSHLLPGFLERVQDNLNDPQYNLYLHSSPLHTGPFPDYHWHFKFMPKLTKIAGFELSTNVFINVTTPEASAQFLQENGGKIIPARRDE